MNDFNENLKNLLMERIKKINDQKDIEKQETQFIADLVIEYLDKLKPLIDPKEEYNTKTLVEKCFSFISGQLKDTIKHIYFGMGSYSKHDFKKFNIYEFGWIGINDYQVILSEKGHEIAREFYKISGYKERTWYTPAKNDEELIKSAGD